MDTAALEELRALRARAYGPHADIAHDPAAVRRLRDLEAQSSGSTTRSRAAAATDVTTTLPPGPEPDSAQRSEFVSASAPPPAPAPAPTAAGEETPARGPAGVERPHGEAPKHDPIRSGATADRTERRSHRLGLIWALSVVASAALAAGITYAATSMAPVQTSSGAPQIATLEPSPLLEIPAGWFGAGSSSRVFEFYGLTLFETPNGFGYTSPGTDCFMAIPTEQLPAEDADPNSWSISGNVYSGCRIGDFPATTAIPVDSGMPEELRDRFPPGSALQFVLDGDRMGVFLDSP
ncbi:hypothetical protein [Microbacterium sp. CPCC 204701]|uniref:hypothetical protein n=1 Tax=Microbacterium sp. CPCC 204701 TaxID=2493084 RepID=UPI000FDA194E|nr:hypothetical protein [Microbacterium sp. CPCC 204701]